MDESNQHYLPIAESPIAKIQEKRPNQLKILNHHFFMQKLSYRQSKSFSLSTQHMLRSRQPIHRQLVVSIPRHPDIYWQNKCYGNNIIYVKSVFTFKRPTIMKLQMSRMLPQCLFCPVDVRMVLTIQGSRPLAVYDQSLLRLNVDK